MIILTIIELVATAVTLVTTQPPPPPNRFEGSLSRYAPQVMEETIVWRDENNNPPGFSPYREQYAAYLAVIGCWNVGRAGWLTITVEGETRPPVRALVTDCGSPGGSAAQWFDEDGICCEVDYAFWQREGIEDGRGAWAVLVLDGR